MDALQQNYQQLLAYNDWANNSLLITLEEIEENYKNLSPKILQLFSHIIIAQEIWLSRVKGVVLKQAIWETWTLKEIQQRSIQSTKNWIKEVKMLNLDKGGQHKIAYQNTSGKQFMNTFHEILAHIVNHGTYHRGQINQLLVKQQYKPPVIDFIFYVRR